MEPHIGFFYFTQDLLIGLYSSRKEFNQVFHLDVAHFGSTDFRVVVLDRVHFVLVYARPVVVLLD